MTPNFGLAAAYFRYAADAVPHNLAALFYSPDGIAPDQGLWITTMTQASIAGSARASFTLAEHYHKTDPIQAAEFLEKAKEQNYEKFDHRFYQEIVALKERMGG